MAEDGPSAERQVLAENGAKLHVGFQVTDPGHFMVATGWFPARPVMGVYMGQAAGRLNQSRAGPPHVFAAFRDHRG